MDPWIRKSLKSVEKMISAQYDIGEMIGIGSTSVAFMATSEGGLPSVLKIPRDEIAAATWGAMIQDACNNCDRYCADYEGEVRVIRPMEINENFVIEPLAAGVPLTYEVYSSLRLEEQHRLSSSFSKFLYHAHQSNSLREPHPAVLDGGIISIEDSITLFKNAQAISSQEEQSFRQTHELFKFRNTDDEISCLVHGDYSASNVFYDIQSGTLSILDFGSSCVDCIYRDFVPAFAHVSTQVSYRFFADVIRDYNDFGQGVISISVEKAALFHYLAAIHESGLMAYCQELDDEETKRLVDTFLIPILNRISEMVDTSAAN